MALEIEMWPTDKPVDYARNARKITEKAVDKVAASIKEFGFRQPVVVDKEGVICIGHVRRRSAKKLGLAEIPVHIASDLTPGQIKALRIMDNRSSDEVQFDFELLGPELLDLKLLNIDLALTGFDMPELDRILNVGGATEGEDDVPEPPVNPVTRLGDMWLLDSAAKGASGETLQHRVLCGDSTKAEDVSVLLGGVPAPFLMCIDQPYGDSYDPEWRLDAGLNKPWQTRAEGKVKNDDRVDWSAAYALFPGDVIYAWHAGIHAGEVAVGLHSQGFHIRAQIIWAKPSLVIGRGHYHWQHEPCWMAVRKGKTTHWSGDRKQSTLWQVENMHRTQGNVDDGKTSHATQKPVELYRRPILNHTKAGDAVEDCFLGSGTCLVACELTERVCYGCEIEPNYVDMAVIRWQNLTKRTAVLHGDGRTFAEVECERAQKAAA